MRTKPYLARSSSGRPPQGLRTRRLSLGKTSIQPIDNRNELMEPACVSLSSAKDVFAIVQKWQEDTEALLAQKMVEHHRLPSSLLNRRPRLHSRSLLPLYPNWLPFVSRLSRIHQLGSKRGSDMGPISVSNGSFPLFNASLNFAKLLKINQFRGLGWVRSLVRI